MAASLSAFRVAGPRRRVARIYAGRRMRPVLIFTHSDDRGTGLVGDGLQNAGCTMVQSNPADGLPSWSIDEIAAIVSFDGRAGRGAARDHARTW
jgi:hypothetical protein